MVLEFFNRDRFLVTGNLFSDKFEDINRYAYHGSSSVYGEDIERNGLIWPFYPIPQDEILALAATLNEDVDSDLIECLKRSAHRSTRISLAPYSYVALKHAQIKRGGQIVDICRMAIAAGGIASPTLLSKLNELNLAESCVYVIDLSACRFPNVRFESGVFQSTEAIIPSMLAAKIIVPNDFQITDLDGLRSLKPPHTAFLEKNSIASRLAAMNQDDL